MDRFYGIYGIGGILILGLTPYCKKSKFKLFIAGFIMGSAVEYLFSFLTEAILHTQWWDYDNNILNINGRICLLYSFFWGILTIFLVKKINPFIDKMMNKIQQKIPIKVLKSIIVIMTIFIIIDCIATCFAQQLFILRMIKENDIKVEKQEEMLKNYDRIYGNETLSNWIRTVWSDEKMIRTFPNMKIEDKDNNIIYLDSLLPDIQPYYYKIFEK